jgi:hypothetical protein
MIWKYLEHLVDILERILHKLFFLTPFHAINSILFPIFLTYLFSLYPEQSVGWENGG